jgi:hypothetical protein
MKIWRDASFIFNHSEVYFQSRPAICAILKPDQSLTMLAASLLIFHTLAYVEPRGILRPIEIARIASGLPPVLVYFFWFLISCRNRNSKPLYANAEFRFVDERPVAKLS